MNLDIEQIENLNEIFKYIVIFIIMVCIFNIIRNFLKRNEKSLVKINKFKEIKYKIIEKYFKKENLKIRRKLIYLVLIVVAGLAIFTRFYKIDTLLNGLHVDETGMAYDAFCIANYGVDRYLNKFPVYMINFGGGQSALYTYLSAIAIKFLGLNILSIRLPGIVLSLFAIFMGFLLIKKNYGVKWAIIFMLLMIVCPWHVMQSRFGLDCNLLSSMIMISIVLLLISKKHWHYFVTGIFFGLTLYTYALSYIILPIFLSLTLVYMLYTKRIKFIDVVLLGVPILIFAIPLILMLLVNMGYIEQINSFITIPKMFSYRGGEISFENIWENLKMFKTIVTSDQFIYNSIPQFGTIYLFAIPLMYGGMIIAIIETIKNIAKRKFSISAIFMFLFIANIILMCLTGVNVNKINSIYISLLYFVFIMIRFVYRHFKLGFVTICIMYLIMSILFFEYYFNDYNNENSIIGLVDKNMVSLVQEIESLNSDKNIYLEINTHQPWIYVLYSLEMSPYEFNETKSDDSKENWNNMYNVGRYHFELPETLEEGIYVFEKGIEESDEQETFKDELVSDGYKLKDYGNYEIYYL